MCLVSIAWKVHPEFPLVFVGNRDEFYERPSAAADWWTDQPDILGGRDLEAGGSWLGVNDSGRFAVVTNRPDLAAPQIDALSRGELVTGWLANPSIIEQLPEQHERYGGFSLLLATRDELFRISGGNGVDELEHIELPPGIYGLSNTAPEDPWPKLNWLNEQVGKLLDGGDCNHDALMQPLLKDQPIADDIEPLVAALPFIRGDGYGTRCATVVTVNRHGAGQLTERSFGPEGAELGTVTHSFPSKS